MAYYLVTYDLRKEKDASGYEQIYDALKSYSDWCWPLESVWIVGGTSAKAILSHLSSVLDDNDGIIVAELTGELCFRRVKQGAAEWLRKRFVCR